MSGWGNNVWRGSAHTPHTHVACVPTMMSAAHHVRWVFACSCMAVVQVLYRSSQGDSAHVRQEASVCDGMQISAMDALSELIKVSFVRGHHTCPKCGGALSEPKPREADSCGNRSDGRLRVRCKTNQCNKTFNILDFCVFGGARLKRPDVLRGLNHYTRSNVLKPPLVADCQRQLRLPRTCVEHIHNALLHKEVKAGRAHCAKKQCAGWGM